MLRLGNIILIVLWDWGSLASASTWHFNDEKKTHTHTWHYRGQEKQMGLWGPLQKLFTVDGTRPRRVILLARCRYLHLRPWRRSHVRWFIVPLKERVHPFSEVSNYTEEADRSSALCTWAAFVPFWSQLFYPHFGGTSGQNLWIITIITVNSHVLLRILNW